MAMQPSLGVLHRMRQTEFDALRHNGRQPQVLTRQVFPDAASGDELAQCVEPLRPPTSMASLWFIPNGGQPQAGCGLAARRACRRGHRSECGHPLGSK